MTRSGVRMKRSSRSSKAGVSDLTGASAAAGPEADGPATPNPVAWLRAHPALAALLALSLILLLAHSWVYRFLTDDAYISFRYARNLADGHGLVFNPGMERVEGYSNFLWVLILAGFDALGAPIEISAQVLSVAATVGLWVLIVHETLRWLPAPGRAWLVLVPAWAMAMTRSVAVWSTSGLETRLFELLLVAAALRLVREVEAVMGGAASRPWAAVLLALAALTRPDGMLLSVSALAMAGAWLLAHGRFQPRQFAMLVAPFVILVGAHLAFRLAYYGEWLPNTYHVKIGGRLWWDLGFLYVSAFVLEYACYLWIPLLVSGVTALVRQGRSFFPLLIAGMLIPHMVYVVAIGGDHFEYRPLDLIFPFAFLLIYHGARAWARTPLRTAGGAVLLAAMAIGLWELPFQAHRQMPDFHAAGFPGGWMHRVEAREFLSPDRDPIYSLPGLRRIAEMHRRLVSGITTHFAGIRQEEHRWFLASVKPSGLALRQLMDDGRLPRDTYLALPCVGVISYVTGLRVLDMSGLNDSHVARSPFFQKWTLAHDKKATEEYVLSRGADLWTGVRPVCAVDSADFNQALEETLAGKATYFAAAIGNHDYLLGRPLDLERLARLIPRLRFDAMSDARFRERSTSDAIAMYQERLSEAPDDDAARTRLATLLGDRGEFARALPLFEEAAARNPDDGRLWMRVGWCHAGLGKPREAVEALEKSIAISRSQGQNETAADAERILGTLVK
jgi:hypothetical protein